MPNRRGRQPIEIGLDLQIGRGRDDSERDRLTRSLRQELLQLPVQDVRLVENDAAPGTAKGLSMVAVGGLVVKVLNGEAIKTVIDALRVWLARDANRGAKLVVDGKTIELTGLTGAQQERLIDAWIQQVSGGAARPKTHG